jgi:hypothetical protein
METFLAQKVLELSGKQSSLAVMVLETNRNLWLKHSDLLE